MGEKQRLIQPDSETMYAHKGKETVCCRVSFEQLFKSAITVETGVLSTSS